jgi:hypothetical protein
MNLENWNVNLQAVALTAVVHLVLGISARIFERTIIIGANVNIKGLGGG